MARSSLQVASSAGQRKRKETASAAVSDTSSNNSSKISSKKHNRDGTPRNTTTPSTTLWWPSTEPYVPLTAEQDLTKVLLRWGAKERGMLCSAPEFRRRDIQQKCYVTRIRLSQACSLRRHHLQQLNPYKSKESLQLGTTADIRAAAELFERAIESFLDKKGTDYYSEEEQKAQWKANNKGTPQPGTPDFKLKEPVLLKVYSNNPNYFNDHTKQRVHAERTIHWIEAKMFYGASTIPSDGKSAVGAIVPKMKKYVKLYGEGAIVFSQGCGEVLAQELQEIGVTALSCFSEDFDFTELHEQQRTWCADKNGNIMP